MQFACNERCALLGLSVGRERARPKSFEQSSSSALDVFLAEFREPSRIASAKRLKHFSVLLACIVSVACQIDLHADIGFRHAAQRPRYFGEALASARRNDAIVKLVVQQCPLRLKLRCAWIEGIHLFDDSLYVCNVLRGPRLSGDSSRVLFKDHPQLEDLHDFVGVEGRHHVPTSRSRFNQPISFKLAQSLSQRNATHVEAAGKLFLPENLAGLEIADQDICPKLVVEHSRQRRAVRCGITDREIAEHLFVGGSVVKRVQHHV